MYKALEILLTAVRILAWLPSKELVMLQRRFAVCSEEVVFVAGSDSQARRETQGTEVEYLSSGTRCRSLIKHNREWWWHM